MSGSRSSLCFLWDAQARLDSANPASRQEETPGRRRAEGWSREEGMLPLVGKMLKDKSMQEAASRLFGGLDDCFEDMVAAAK